MSIAVQVSLSGTFFERLAQARSSILLLDYDGTVAPFVAERDKAFPYPGVRELVDAIMSTCHTRVVFVSGRPAAEIPPLFGTTPCPEVWGCHGLDRWIAGTPSSSFAVEPEVRSALARVIEALLQCGLEEMLEVKPGSVVVHLRGLNATHRAAVHAITQPALAAAAIPGQLEVREFDGGLELRVATPHKGDVVRAVLEDLNPNVPVAFLGDDLTDEDAFVALNGRGLTVLVRPELRPTAAQMWIRPPEELRDFLADWLRAAGGEL
jgi:trehalose-phosphatase